jgi:hypothetical protein
MLNVQKICLRPGSWIIVDGWLIRFDGTNNLGKSDIVATANFRVRPTDNPPNAYYTNISLIRGQKPPMCDALKIDTIDSDNNGDFIILVPC